MRRGEVWWTRFDPAIGDEIGKTRPAIILSNDRSNVRTNRVQVVPVTSQIRKVYPSETLVMIGGNMSKAVADQIRTVDKSRLLERMHRITDAEMKGVEAAIAVQLALC